jgi:hypothetical protein
MATVISKTYDIQHGTVVLQVEDALNRVMPHTVYVVKPDGTPNDVAAEIAAILAAADAWAASMQAGMTAAGWTSGN